MNWTLHQGGRVSRSQYTGTSAVAGTPQTVFHSDWSTQGNTATGNQSDAALRDTNQTKAWDTTLNHASTDLTVVQVVSNLNNPPAVALPTASFTNCLQVSHQASVANGGNGSRAAWVALQNFWPSPQIGDARYFRVYQCVTIPDSEGDLTSGVNSHHPFVTCTSDGNYTDDQLGTDWLWAPDGAGGFLTLFQEEQITSQKFGSWAPSASVGSASELTKNAWWRREWKLVKTATNTYTLDMNIYAGDSTTATYTGSTIRSRIGLNSSYDAGSELATGTNSQNLPIQDDHSGLIVGTNGSSALGNLTAIRYSYWGALCIRSDTWCGPYANGI